ncbi:MAG: methyltransferase domain-containing protein [Nitrososphaerota archaeon]
MATNTYSSTWFRLYMPRQTEELTRNEVAFLSRQLPLPRYRRLLDLCCGQGRHAIGMAESGYEVTGLDRDAEALAEAERRTRAANQHVTYVNGDMREVGALPGMFDAVINMWQSLAYFDEATNAELLRQIHGKLTPGGRFIVDLYNREFFERNQGEKREEIAGTIVDSRGYMEGNRWHSVITYRDAHGDIIDSDHMEWQMFTPGEFVAWAAEYGFTSRLVCTWADENRAPSPDVARMQVVLERG